MISIAVAAATTFTLILTYLLTDSTIFIGLLFAFILYVFGEEAGGNPFVALPKFMLGRSELHHFRNTLLAQATATMLAYGLYRFLVSGKYIRPHPLDKL